MTDTAVSASLADPVQQAIAEVTQYEIDKGTPRELAQTFARSTVMGTCELLRMRFYSDFEDAVQVVLTDDGITRVTAVALAKQYCPEFAESD